MFWGKHRSAPNLVQLMPTYQEALKLAVDKKYGESMTKFEQLMDEITKEHSTNTPYHIFVLYKMATVNNLAGKVTDNEAVFERINEIAPMAYHDKPSMVFMCHNTLFKYYLHYDVDKSWKFGEDMKSNKIFELDKLSLYEKNDFYHSLGTAYSLEGTSHQKSFDCFDQWLELSDLINMNAEKPQFKVNKGHALNNLGISRFWYFMEKTREIGEMKISDENKSQEAKKYVPTLEQGIKDLKNSVLQFEDFGGRLFPDFEKSGKLNEVQMKQKLFIDEFFNTEIKETLPQNFSHYDLHDNHMNTKFLIELFTKAESFLPIANLGEISLIFNKMKEAVALLDVSLKVIVERDPGNLIRNKIISDLSWL